MLMRTLIFFNLFFSFAILAQEDTIRTQDIDNVIISIRKEIISPIKYKFYLNRKEIEEIQPSDAGDLIQKFSGITMKSYGGLGGLKTVSMRGLGSNHTAIVVDGFAINNSQTGQTNLSQIQADNVQYIFNSTINTISYLIPVSSQIAGSSVYIATFENTYVKDTIAIRSNVKMGSFNQKDIYVGAKYKFKKVFVSAFGKYRNAEGDYSYKFSNGLNDISSTRTNNDYLDYYYGATVGYQSKRKVKLKIGYKTSTIDQGLPGAVILYNETADERLYTNNHILFTDGIFMLDKMYFRIHGKLNINDTKYTDPTFLNNIGGVNVDYLNQSGSFGFSFIRDFKQKFQLSGGVEQQISSLVASDSLFAKPIRNHNFGVLGLMYVTDRINVTAQISSQYVLEENDNGKSAKDFFRLNPYLKFESKEKGKFRMRHQLWYRNSFRMPTFNELYYNNIGNTALNPEEANQFNYTISFKSSIKKKPLLYINSSIYFNRVTDKIVAIPTMNLFVWSMQNIGITNTYGGDISIKYIKILNPKMELIFDVNYSYNKTIDVTDKLEPTFGHQIAYIPVHTSNIDLSFHYSRIGFRISNYLNSKRYSLNENVVQNEVNGFLITDFTTFYKLPVKSKQNLTLRLSVKNIFNQSYSYVRSYVMPGVNYLISLNYAFN